MADPALQNLQKIDHIVVLMQENRSFDHLLGYLALTPRAHPVDGLQPAMKNTHAGVDYHVHHLASTRLGHDQNPCHTGACVRQQMAGSMGGFVDSYAATHPADPHPDVAMGYYTGADLPVFDQLAAEYAVCDRWFSSVPGATWPNRLYAASGGAAGSLDNRKVPLYDVATFPRHLDAAKVGWRWYYHDVPTLRLMDERYRFDVERFATFSRRQWLMPKTFLDAAAAGELPPVAWIDPNFTDQDVVGPTGANDDHPPSDVHDGQDLVLRIYHALTTARTWPRTLLVIVYDEHGGLYDHVSPPATGETGRFARYGPRVPALVVSPFVERGTVSSTLYDHTSLIRTILERFCRSRTGAIPDLGPRVAQANHLGGLLTLAKPRPAPPATALEPLIAAAARYRSETFGEGLRTAAAVRAAPPELDEFQQGLVTAMERLARRQASAARR
jgi:phospholipase C